MTTSVSLFPLLLPVALTLTGGLATLAAEPFLAAERKHDWLPWTAAIAVLAAIIALFAVDTGHVHGLYAMDSARVWLCGGILGATLIALGGLQASLRRDAFPGGEPHALLLFAACGAQLMVMATDWLALFVGVELASLAVYALVGLRRQHAESGEGLYKYFVMGSVFSAVLLYGVAMTYGATGSTHVGAAVQSGSLGLWFFGQALILVALLFKVGAFPFHFWSPDAYTGAPVAITGFMGAVIKVGGFAAIGAQWLALIVVANGGGVPADQVLFLDRGIELTVLPGWLSVLQQIVLVLAVLSLWVGHFSGLGQRSARRLIAYSSVANAGYLLLALALPAAGSVVSLGSLWVYLVAYAIATAGTLTALAWLADHDDRHDDLDHLAGQCRRDPFTGLVLTVFLASTAGLPITIGFIGKFLILSDLVAKGWLVIAILAMVMALIGAAYYLGLLATLWGSESKREPAPARSALAVAALAVAALAIFALCWPGWLVPGQMPGNPKVAAVSP
ncbi:NADH-quinone oxidoreductase subunit N [Planctomycetota bacterium]|nr:NADH-quinone oxidoreductase subunit N [Planctomycetota bacterium]